MDELPQLTTDLDTVARDLEVHGYALVGDALSSTEVAAVRSRLVEVARTEMEAGEGFVDQGGANQRVWTLLNKGQEFCDLVTNPVALRIVDRMLGDHPNGPLGRSDDLPAFLLGSVTANIAGPGGSPMGLHADQLYVTRPWPPMPLVANVCWMLDDFTVDNGATEVVPGSHLIADEPDEAWRSRAVPAVGPAGTALVFDGRLWHGTGANRTTNVLRRGVLAYYCRSWMRTQEDHVSSTRVDVLDTASPALRRLIGLDMYHSLGMRQGLPPTGERPAPHLRAAVAESPHPVASER